MDRNQRIERNARAIALVERAEASGEPLDLDSRREVVDTYTGLGGLVETGASGLAGLAEARGVLPIY